MESKPQIQALVKKHTATSMMLVSGTQMQNRAKRFHVKLLNSMKAN